VNVAEDFPAAIDTLAGKVALAVLLASFTTSPPAGAGPDRVMAPEDEAPPSRLVGLSVTDSNVTGLMVSAAVSVVELNAALIVAVT
jgi:hypothetical protein